MDSNNIIATNTKNINLNYHRPHLFKWFFWVSMILFVLLYISNIIVLFLNPNKLVDFKIDEQVYLGFYSLSVATNDLYLNWIAYFFGFFIIVLAAINCLGYWMFCNHQHNLSFRKTEVIILFLTSIIALILIYILNIFNKPLFDISQLDLVNNNWNFNLDKPNWTTQFNYVYDISFISNQLGEFNTFLSISKFSIIWILMIIIVALIYIITTFVCLYYAELRSTLKNKEPY